MIEVLKDPSNIFLTNSLSVFSRIHSTQNVKSTALTFNARNYGFNWAQVEYTWSELTLVVVGIASLKPVPQLKSMLYFI